MDNKNQLPVLCNLNGYVFYEGKLQACKYHHTHFNMVQTTPERAYTHQHVVKLHNGDLIAPEDNEIFDTIEDYENGKIAETHMNDNVRFVVDVSRRVGLYSRSKEETILFYTFENGAPVEHNEELRCFNFVYDGDKTVEKCEIFPEGQQIYANREEALSFNSYTIVHKNGKKEVRDGVNKLLILDPDQRELLDQFIEIAKKLQESGVMLEGDFCEQYSAYNTRHVAEITLDDSYGIDRESFGWECAERGHRAFDVKLPIPIWSDECKVYIKRNKEDKK